MDLCRVNLLDNTNKSVDTTYILIDKWIDKYEPDSSRQGQAQEFGSRFLDFGLITPPPAAWGSLKENIQIFSYRLAKPSKPIFFPKVEKSDANWRFLGQKKLAITQA